MWGNTRIRVALALDATGSMANSGKIPAMKEAAKELIDQLSANAKTAGDLYISMIPFSTPLTRALPSISSPGSTGTIGKRSRAIATLAATSRGPSACKSVV